MSNYERRFVFSELRCVVLHSFLAGHLRYMVSSLHPPPVCREEKNNSKKKKQNKVRQQRTLVVDRQARKEEDDVGRIWDR